MAINRSTQQRQNYGLGSFVKKTFNKVARPFTKVAQKLMPKELAGVAQMAAPFLGPVAGPLAYAAGQAKQKGRINPFGLAAIAAPYARFSPGGGFQYGSAAQLPDTYGIRDLITGGGRDSVYKGKNLLGSLSDRMPGSTDYGLKADEFLFGRPEFDPENDYGVGTGGAEGDGITFPVSGADATPGIIGSGGEMSQLIGDGPGILDSKMGRLLLGSKGTSELNLLKAGSWTLGIVQGIKEKKFASELEAADAAEQALLAADSAATSGDIEATRQWAINTFSSLTREDIGLKYAQGGRVNYAIGSNPLPSDPTAPVNPFKPKPIGPVLPNKEMAMSYGYDDAMGETYNTFLQMKERKEIPIEMDFDEFLRDVVPEMSKMQTEGNTMMAANGGLMRTNYALGTRPEPKESGLGGLPIEADMRYTGGFMPYGKKEKADDVPARLSKNEFVFTADAVKAAGGGSMNEGARKMYQTMKMLEQKNRMTS